MQGPRIAALFTTLLCSTSSSADFVGLNISSSYWTADLAGSFNSSSSVNNINIDSSTDAEASFAISFEHPIPALPNFKFQNRSLNASGSDPSANINFNGQNFNNGVSSTLDLSHKDIVLYYELLDNWVNLDLGINLKTFDGEVTVSDNSGGNESISIDETIPVVYLSARFDLPFTGFYIGADIQNITLTDDTAEDSTLMVGYETSAGFGVEGGYKKFSLGLDDASNLNTTIEYDGLYINGYIHF